MSIKREIFRAISVLFSSQIVDFLNDLYVSFDEIISRFDVYKVRLLSVGCTKLSGILLVRSSMTIENFQLFPAHAFSYHPLLIYCKA